MKLLVATRNKDKFRIVRLLVRSIAPQIELVPLFETEIKGDVIEEGTMEERALQKAKFFLDKVGTDKFDGVLGIDDGIQIEDQEPSPNSKELTDSILNKEYPKGSSIAIVRAYALSTKDGIHKTALSRVPFIFLGNEQRITRIDGNYPLSKVLAPKGHATPISDWNDKESNQFTLEHSRDALTKVLSNL